MKTLHFGVFGPSGGDEMIPPTILGREGVLALSLSLAGHQAYVSGTWDEWGEEALSNEDQSYSAHVSVEIPDDLSPRLILRLRWALLYMIDPTNDVLDYAIVTDHSDWSQVSHVVTFHGTPEVVVWEAYQGGSLIGGREVRK